jgi:hypothetical protein
MHRKSKSSRGAVGTARSRRRRIANMQPTNLFTSPSAKFGTTPTGSPQQDIGFSIPPPPPTNLFTGPEAKFGKTPTGSPQQDIGFSIPPPTGWTPDQLARDKQGRVAWGLERQNPCSMKLEYLLNEWKDRLQQNGALNAIDNPEGFRQRFIDSIPDLLIWGLEMSPEELKALGFKDPEHYIGKAIGTLGVSNPWELVLPWELRSNGPNGKF